MFPIADTNNEYIYVAFRTATASPSPLSSYCISTSFMAATIGANRDVCSVPFGMLCDYREYVSK